ncbi:MAG: hypothetical protein K1Y36_04730 [Blastocatellia bacterium]|nr:hypothetical protein [Blastocatellia bacterium]
MNHYQPRKITLVRFLTVNNWKIKIYTITRQTRFAFGTTMQAALSALPAWLEQSRTLGFENYETAFLIVHEGIDGIWTLLNWWVEGGILYSRTFFTALTAPTEFQVLPREGFMSCVWEMEVIHFERAMWIEHILKKADQPDFERYWQASWHHDGSAAPCTEPLSETATASEQRSSLT